MMNKFKFPVVLLLATLWLSPLNKPDTDDLTKGLVAYYSFNDCNARDESGNGSDGKLFGNVGCWCGIEDDGLLFNGKHDYVEFYGIVNRYFTTSDFTISFYFKSNQYSVLKQSLFSKRESCEKYNALDFRLDRNLSIVETDFNETPVKDYGDISPETGENGWKHFVLARKGFKAYTYINGVLIREGHRCSGVDITNEAVLSFSNSPCVYEGGATRFKGILDELRVYDRALDESEVENLYLLNPVEKAEQDCVS
jgi:hypothetical protein